MTPVLVSVDKAGDLKLGRKKCRLHKKADVVKVAKKYGIVQAEKLTIKEMCEGLKMRAKNSPLARDLLRHAAKRGVRTDNLNLYNNVPLAKLYPEAAKKRFPDFFKVSDRLRDMRNEKDKKRAAAKKRAEKKALDKKVAANFMKGMTTKIASPKRIITIVKVTPSKKAKSINKEEATKRIDRMKISGSNKNKLYEMMYLNQRSPRHVVRVARELARLR
jgi:hypothetical protein